MSWGAPIDSVHTFAPGKMYVHDTWYSDLPDTFAILPRTASGIYFSMEDWMNPRVLCLGGPNLNPATLEPTYLRNTMKYNQKEIDLVHQESCFTLFNDYYNGTSDGVVWSKAGASERFLQRKFKHFGWEIQNQNIALVSLHIVLLRLPMEPGCFYLHPKQMIHWARVSNVVNSVMVGSCHLMNYDLKHYNQWSGSISDCTHNTTVPFNPHILRHQVEGKLTLSALSDT